MGKRCRSKRWRQSNCVFISQFLLVSLQPGWAAVRFSATERVLVGVWIITKGDRGEMDDVERSGVGQGNDLRQRQMLAPKELELNNEKDP